MKGLQVFGKASTSSTFTASFLPNTFVCTRVPGIRKDNKKLSTSQTPPQQQGKREEQQQNAKTLSVSALQMGLLMKLRKQP